MAFDSHKNFAYSTVATAPSPATSGTSLVVAAAGGAKFPTPPFNASIWPIGVQPTSANAEIVRVTGISTDTLTITRAQEGSSARTVVIGDQIAATVTSKTFTDVETQVLRLTSRQGGTTGNATWQTAGTSNTDISALSVFAQFGCLTSSAAGGSTITFPVSFNQIPLIWCTVDSGSNGFWAQHEQVTATNFVMTCWSATGTLVAKNVNWLAIGQ